MQKNNFYVMLYICVGLGGATPNFASGWRAQPPILRRVGGRNPQFTALVPTLQAGPLPGTPA
jgi:hypothetical protein